MRGLVRLCGKGLGAGVSEETLQTQRQARILHGLAIIRGIPWKAWRNAGRSRCAAEKIAVKCSLITGGHVGLSGASCDQYSVKAKWLAKRNANRAKSINGIWH